MNWSPKVLIESVQRIFTSRSSLEHHIALFGESGCGKTTLLSTFYGHQQAASFRKANGYSLLAKNTGQGNKLLGAYNRLEDDLLPPANAFEYTEYDFAVRVPSLPVPAAHLRWYDYPGEWWTESKEGAEHKRKEELIAKLVQSDVGFLLVDGAKMMSQPGRYLKRLFGHFRDELVRQRGYLSGAKTKVKHYPKIWVICLSKTDLYESDYDAERLKGDVLKHADQELNDLRDEISAILADARLDAESVSIGEEFLLLSSAVFDPTTSRVVDPKTSIGVDLIAPLALSIPLRHAYRRASIKAAGRIAASDLTEALRHLVIRPLRLLPFVGSAIDIFDESVQTTVKKLRKGADKGRERRDAIEVALDAMRARLSANGAARAYCGIDLPRI